MSAGRIAILVCTNVIGGHEFQAAELGKSLAKNASVTFFVNQLNHVSLFESTGLEVCDIGGILLEPGSLPFQILNSWRHRAVIRALVEKYDHVIVSAGTVEAGISVGFCLHGYKPNSLYLPSFCDRVLMWGWLGHIYNCILGALCKVFDQIIVINKIQARIIQAFTRVPTIVVENKIRKVIPSDQNGPRRLVFVGRLDNVKRVDEMMIWLDSDENPISQLLLVGDGPLRQELEALAKTFQHLKCSFLGWKSPEEQDHLIRSSDVLVLNSLVEGEPMVIREGRLRGMHFAVRNIHGVRGITSRKERFSSQKEFLDILSNIEGQSRLQGAIDQATEEIESEIKRFNNIKVLLSKIFI